MARYYLVNFVHRADGHWQSPPECEEVWKAGCFKQVRFDDASGVALVKCMGDMTLPFASCRFLAAPTVEIRDWLATIARYPKSGPTHEKPNDPVVPYTLDEEAAAVKRIGAGWVE